MRLTLTCPNGAEDLALSLAECQLQGTIATLGRIWHSRVKSAKGLARRPDPALLGAMPPLWLQAHERQQRARRAGGNRAVQRS